MDSSKNTCNSSTSLLVLQWRIKATFERENELYSARRLTLIGSRRSDFSFKYKQSNAYNATALSSSILIFFFPLAQNLKRKNLILLSIVCHSFTIDDYWVTPSSCSSNFWISKRYLGILACYLPDFWKKSLSIHLRVSALELARHHIYIRMWTQRRKICSKLLQHQSLALPTSV